MLGMMDRQKPLKKKINNNNKSYYTEKKKQNAGMKNKWKAKSDD